MYRSNIWRVNRQRGPRICRDEAVNHSNRARVFGVFVVFWGVYGEAVWVGARFSFEVNVWLLDRTDIEIPPQRDEEVGLRVKRLTRVLLLDA